MRRFRDRLPGWAQVGLLVAVGGLAIVVGAVVASGGRSSPHAVTERLPDLLQRSPYRLTGATVRTPRGPRFRLGFASAVENVGTGPLLIVGRRRSATEDSMAAHQLVIRSDGSTRTVRDVGRLRYTVATSHQHWHLLPFERYELRRVPSGRGVLRRDQKTGFCLGDRYDARPTTRLPGEPDVAVWTQECGKNRRDLLTLREGISVGFGDDYDPHVEGQFIDVTRLAAGRYELVHRVNADRGLRESNHWNNASSIVIDLSWPRGFAHAPRIAVVARCGDGRRCPAPG